MPYDQRLGKGILQLPEKLPQGRFLRFRPRIPGLCLCIQSSLVTDSDGVAVVVPAMGPGLSERPSGMYQPVACDVEVVSDIPEPPVYDMLPPTFFEIQAPPLWGGGAMDDNQCDGPHLRTGRH